MMRLPVVFLVASALLFVSGLGGEAVHWLALLSAVAALVLLAKALIFPAAALQFIIIDGSNVMHWGGGAADLALVRAVVAQLAARGLTPLVWFDANAGYLVSDRYMGPDRLARALSVASRQVFVAPKGVPADPLVLKDAEALGARVVTNDRYRDWAVAHPVVGEAGRFTRGEVVAGVVRLGGEALTVFQPRVPNLFQRQQRRGRWTRWTNSPACATRLRSGKRG